MKKNALIIVLLFALALMVVALYNGFPLTDSDTGAYISGGIESKILADRPPFYGWFIRYTSLWSSLWYTVFAQCLILAYLLLRYIRLLEKNITAPRIFFATGIAIVAFTTVSWEASFLMPDIFGGILLLAILLLVADAGAARSTTALYVLIILFSLLVHNSHILVVFLFSFITLIAGFVKRLKPLVRKSVLLLSACVVCFLTMCTVNYSGSGRFTFSRGGHVFLMGRLSEMGILKQYLTDSCEKKHLLLCSAKDNIGPHTWDFIWSSQNPYNKMSSWDSSEGEYNMIIHDVFSSPKYVGMFVQKSFTGTLRQLTQVQAPEKVRPETEGSSPWLAINNYFADEANEYISSLQSNNLLGGATCNYLYLFVFVVTSLWIVLKNIATKEAIFVYALLALFLVVNAFVSSACSTVLERYQNRVFWIMPATNIICLVNYYAKRWSE